MSVLTEPPRSGHTEAVAPVGPARLAALLAMVVVVVGSVVGPTGRFDVLLGGGAVRVAAGSVQVGNGSSWDPVPVGEVIRPGEGFRVVDGVATLDVPGGVVDLADGTRGAVAPEDAPGPDLAVEAGTAVVQSPQVAVGEGVVAAQGAGAWRYDASGRVAAYEGATLLTDAAGRETLVRGLEQTLLQGGTADGEPRPYVYVGDDPFDRQYLAPALGVDDFVSALRGGLVADYGTVPQPVAFYTDFDGLDGPLMARLGALGFDRVQGRVGPPADVLVASVVTEALVVDAGLAPVAAADEVRTERVAGASWGLIAQARELDASNVRAAADRALQRRQLEEQQGTASPLQPPPGAGPSSTPGPGQETDADTSPPGDTADPDPDDGSQPDGPGDDGGTDGDDEDPGLVGGVVEDLGADEVLPDPLDDTVDGVVDVVDDVVGDTDSSSTEDGDEGSDDGDGLLGTTEDVVEGTTDTVGGLLGG